MSPMRSSTEQAEREKQQRERVLHRGLFVERVAPPLPLKIEPPHANLCAKGRLSIRHVVPTVLLALHICNQSRQCSTAECAIESWATDTRCRFTFVNGGIVRGANGFKGKWCHAEHQYHRRG